MARSASTISRGAPLQFAPGHSNTLHQQHDGSQRLKSGRMAGNTSSGSPLLIETLGDRAADGEQTEETLPRRFTTARDTV